MGREETMPIRVSKEALEAARIAAAYAGVSIAKYVSDVVLKAATEDIEKGHRDRSRKTTRRTKPEESGQS